MVVDLLEVINRQVILVVPVILLKDGRDLLLSLVPVGFSVHGLHELDEGNASSLLHVELGHNFVSSLAIGVEAILRQQQFQVVGQQHSHASGVIGIEHFLQIEDVLIIEGTRDVELGLKLAKILALETNTVLTGSVYPGLGLIRRVAEFL